MFILLSVLALCFLSEITLYAIFDNVACLVCCSCIKNQNCHTLFRMKLTIKQRCPANNNKISPFL